MINEAKPRIIISYEVKNKKRNIISSRKIVDLLTNSILMSLQSLYVANKLADTLSRQGLNIKLLRPSKRSIESFFSAQGRGESTRNNGPVTTPASIYAVIEEAYDRSFDALRKDIEDTLQQYTLKFSEIIYGIALDVLKLYCKNENKNELRELETIYNFMKKYPFYNYLYTITFDRTGEYVLQHNTIHSIKGTASIDLPTTFGLEKIRGIISNKLCTNCYREKAFSENLNILKNILRYRERLCPRHTAIRLIGLLLSRSIKEGFDPHKSLVENKDDQDKREILLILYALGKRYFGKDKLRPNEIINIANYSFYRLIEKACPNTIEIIKNILAAKDKLREYVETKFKGRDEEELKYIIDSFDETVWLPDKILGVLKRFEKYSDDRVIQEYISWFKSLYESLEKIGRGNEIKKMLSTVPNICDEISRTKDGGSYNRIRFRPSKYYALIYSDADDMSDLIIPGSFAENEIASILNRINAMTMGSEKIIGEFLDSGKIMVFYGAGDDFLIGAPVEEVDTVIKKIDRIAGELGTTISYSISIAHYRSPLREVLSITYESMEKIAKKMFIRGCRAKNTIVFNILPGSGNVRRIILPKALVSIDELLEAIKLVFYMRKPSIMFNKELSEFATNIINYFTKIYSSQAIGSPILMKYYTTGVLESIDQLVDLGKQYAVDKEIVENLISIKNIVLSKSLLSFRPPHTDKQRNVLAELGGLLSYLYQYSKGVITC